MPDQSEKSTLPSHTSPFSTHGDHNHTAQQYRPLNPKSVSEDIFETNAPKTPEGPRSAPRRAVSTPENVGGLDRGARSDRSNIASGSKQKLFTSPCGKKNYVREHYLDRHKLNCDPCKRLSREEDDEDTQRTRDNPGWSSTADDVMEVCPENLDGEIHKPNGDCSPGAQSCDQDTERIGNTDIPVPVESPGGSRLAISNRGSPSSKARTGPIRATSVDGMEIDLEDDDYPEGSPSAKLSIVQADNPLLHDRLKEKLHQRLTPTDKRGYIYIFSDPKRPHLLKIGRTKSILVRMGQINYSCGLGIKLVKHFEVENYIRTEGLIHTYILDLCRPYKCAICKRKHGEWFEIPEQSAVIYADRWATFMTQESPYDGDSKELQPFFRNLVRFRERFLRDSKTEELREDWIQILSPSATDRLIYQFGIVWELFWKFFWPVNSMIAWTISFMAIQHPFIFALMSASVLGTFVTVAQEYDRIRHDGMITAKKAPK